MHLKHLIGMVPFLAVVHGTTWTLRGYDYVDTPDTNCSPGTLGVDEIIDLSGTAPLPCDVVVVDHTLSSIYWDSGGPTDGDSFYVCFYNAFNCPQSSAFATLPEGDFGCNTLIDFGTPAGGLVYFTVKASSDPHC
ncbi:hypothetical protein N431DRAFT_456438 [Stipitochalara longipes BDJ]|nr:hypothetical protein N431DRAFT_456438 [Stipitochalara longipes BDJ]